MGREEEGREEERGVGRGRESHCLADAMGWSTATAIGVSHRIMIWYIHRSDVGRSIAV